MNNAWLNFIDAGALPGICPVKPPRFPGTLRGTFALHRLGNSGIVGWLAKPRHASAHRCRLLPNIMKRFVNVHDFRRESFFYIQRPFAPPLISYDADFH